MEAVSDLGENLRICCSGCLESVLLELDISDKFLRQPALADKLTGNNGDISCMGFDVSNAMFYGWLKYLLRLSDKLT